MGSVEFFIPGADTKKEAKSVYEAIRLHNKSYYPNSEQIYKIRYSHNNKEFEETVGIVSKRNKEIVIAIFNCGKLYIVCTGSRGVVRGEPMLVEIPYYVEHFLSPYL
jgi:hypothetical protein